MGFDKSLFLGRAWGGEFGEVWGYLELRFSNLTKSGYNFNIATARVQSKQKDNDEKIH